MSPKQGFFQTPSPVLLSSPCVVAQGSIGVPQSEQLSYPFRRAIWIEEIRFDLSFSAVAGLNLGALVYAKFQLGRHYLMRDPVPVFLLGTLMDSSQEQLGPDVSSNFSHYRWRLPEPLYVQAGQYLTAEMYRNQDGFTGDINAQISYVGRTVAQSQALPQSICVPYAAPFVTPLNPPGNYVQSNEYSLLNPFDRDIRIQRLTGRYTLILPNATCLSAHDLTPPQGFPAVGPQTTVRIYDSFGGKVVNDFTGVSDVLDIARAAWTFDTVLPAKSQYNVQVWNITADTQVAIAMIGNREEAL